MGRTVPSRGSQPVRYRPGRRPGRGAHSTAAALLIALLAFTLHARIRDTVFVSTGDDGPYRLPDGFIDSASIRVFADSADSNALSFVFAADDATLYLGSPPDSGKRFTVVYDIAYAGLPRTLRLYPKTVHDTARADSVYVPPSFARSSRSLHAPIDIKGYKSISVSLGSTGSTTLEQALDVSLEGRVGRRAKLSAHLTDQATTLEGGTRELSELDRVYLTLQHPTYAVTIGDQQVGWLHEGILAETKKIKGIAAGLTTTPFDIRAVGASARGTVAVDVLSGRDGLQGPYFLDGNGEPDLITPIGGTVEVTLDGEEMKEGADADFTVDYDYGSVTFAPHVLITDESIVRVSYEYKTFDYQRVILGADMEARIGDTAFTVAGALWYESDNENEPIDVAISDEDMELLAQTGDSSIERLVRVPIDSRDVEEWTARYPLYALRDSAGISFFEYVPYDPGTPEAAEDLYWVRFRTVPSGAGEYAVDTIDYRGTIYRYVGPGNGTATAGNQLPLPQRTITGELHARLRPSPWLDMQVNVAGMSHDRNLYSTIDDDDNTSASSRTTLTLGRRSRERRSVWLQADHRLLTRGFTRSVVSTYESTELWQSATLDSGAGMRQIWEAGGGGTLGRYLSADAAYGQIRLDDSTATERLTVRAQSLLGTAFSLSYTGRYFRHALDTLDRGRRESLRMTFDIPRTRLALTFTDQWRHDDREGVGKAGATLAWLWRTPRIEEQLDYFMHGRGTGPLHTFTDTAHSLVWRQSLQARPTAFWQLDGSSVWHYRTLSDSGRDESTVLVNAASDLTFPRRGVATHLAYRLSSERAAALVQLPSYAGDGRGTHSYDSVRGELVPDVNGGFLLREQQVYDNSIDEPVRTSKLEATWSLRPIRRLPGLLGDLRWRGELTLIEHVLPESTETSLSWLPGYLTLAGRDSAAVRLANCYYEQRIGWDPDSLEGYGGMLKLRPYVRRTYRGREEGFAGTLRINRSRKRWFFEMDTDYKHYAHSAASSFSVRDIGGTLTEKYLCAHEIRLYVKETVGWARKNNERGWYAVVRPGISWQPKEKGWAEASYSFAYVKIPGTLDYAMARGFRGGLNHRIDIRADVRLGKHFMLGGGYRGELVRPLGEDEYEKGLHVVSVEVKALL